VRVGQGALPGGLHGWEASACTDGYLNERAGWAESGEVVAHLLRLGQEAGVRTQVGAFDSFLENGSRVSGVVTRAGELIGSDWVVVCAGAWTPGLLPHLSDRMWATAQPVVHLGTDVPDDFRGRRFPPWAWDIAGSGWYGFPAMDDGRIKIGHHGRGTRVDPDDAGVVEEGHVDRLRAFLREAVPPLADAPVVDQRICLYCDSFDGDFFIDRDPDRDGLVVAAGGSGHGFKFAPLLGGLIADVLEGRDNPWAARFRWRTAGAASTEEARYTGA
jgi:glycine/D-amino acid oxidase-like deaminating enzyme